MADAAPPPRRTLSGQRVVLVGNTSWYLHNFRAGTIRALRDRGAEVICVAPEDGATDRLVTDLGVAHVPWPLDLNGANPVREFVSLLRLTAILRRLRPHLVFNFTIKANVYGGLACRLLGIPYANNVTGLGLTIGSGGPLAWFAESLYGLANRGARRVFVQNPDDLALLRERGLLGAAEPVALCGSGVDLDRFAAAPLSASPPTFVMIARLQADKGVRDFIAAARALRARVSEARFVLVGSNRHGNRGAIEDGEIAGWRAEGIVEIPGPAEDVRPWLAVGHAIVLPSHGGEGMPRVLLEAAAAGRPVITSDVPGCRHAVIDGRTGFLHAPGDVAALTERMSRIVSLSTGRLAEMGTAARALAEERFSEGRVVEAYLDCLAPPSRSKVS